MSDFERKIIELEGEIDQLEKRMLEVSGSSKIYNNLKNEQWAKINELKQLKSKQERSK